jgi:hypothetical protein
MKLHTLTLGFLVVLLAACTGTQYDFPIKAPTGQALDAYKAWKHELASNPEHHFRILIPGNWKTLQTTVAPEPMDDKPLEIAVFREPGEWINDPEGAVYGEIVVEVFSLSGSVASGGMAGEAPTDWLKRRLKSGNQTFRIQEERVYNSANGPAADMLVTSGDGEGTIISRMLAVRSKSNPDKIFVVVCSATEEGYSSVSEAFVTAITSFRLSIAPSSGSGSLSSVR